MSILITLLLLNYVILQSQSWIFGDKNYLEESDLQWLAERAEQIAAKHRIVNNLKSLQGTKEIFIPVFVVEEHFEVLKHWFDAVKTGAVPSSGNTLLHIDGHSDGAIPPALSIVPQFRAPRNHTEVVNMMQSNDVFIAAAALAGLIQRYIWVWPAWDFEEHRNESDHEIIEVQVGWRTFYPQNGKPVRQLCGCARPKPSQKNPGSNSEWVCRDHDDDSIEPNAGPIISSYRCTVEMNGTVEMVSETKAVRLLQEGGWITTEDSLLLDIDEDYYGCESSGMPLYSAGLTESIIDTLSDLLGKFLCVRSVRQEYLADFFFHTVIQTILDLKKNECSIAHPHVNCLTYFQLDKALIEMIPHFVSSLQADKYNVLLCMTEEKMNFIMMQVILRLLEDLNVAQLQALDYVGVCLRTAPTNYFFEENSLHVCHGPNTPNHTDVTFHVPTEAENKERTVLLKQMLSLLPRQPSAVTVCRSVRDGYTPWRYFASLEDAVFSTLQNVFSDIGEKSFHFDENLLGGKGGWPGRHS